MRINQNTQAIINHMVCCNVFQQVALRFERKKERKTENEREKAVNNYGFSIYLVYLFHDSVKYKQRFSNSRQKWKGVREQCGGGEGARRRSGFEKGSRCCANVQCTDVFPTDLFHLIATSKRYIIIYLKLRKGQDTNRIASSMHVYYP